jgi:hypothetical protein
MVVTVACAAMGANGVVLAVARAIPATRSQPLLARAFAQAGLGTDVDLPIGEPPDLARALTFATPELDACADETIVYLAQTARLGVVYDGHAPQADTLRALSDSDWAIGHSTTGWLLMLAGACVFYASKRQACIAMSSTEAEIIAASACAVEAVHARALLTEMGLPQESPTVLQVDNTGAVALARERRSCHRSRHVDRRYFKVRELMAEGALHVEHVDTALNTADLLTKSLPLEPFARHRATALGDGAM